MHAQCKEGGLSSLIFGIVVRHYTIKLELCRAHTPRAHCAIYRFTFGACHDGYNFVNFREIEN